MAGFLIGQNQENATNELIEETNEKNTNWRDKQNGRN